MARKNEKTDGETGVLSDEAAGAEDTVQAEDASRTEPENGDGGSSGQGAQRDDDGAGPQAEVEGDEGSPEPDSAQETDAELLQADLERLRDQHLRLAADFENYRKRVSADLSSGWVRAQAELAGSLLEGLDDLQRVSRFTTEDATLETLIEGVDLVERKFMKALTDAGLTAVDPTGEVFDPNTMEAMMRVPVEEEGQDHTVHQVFQKGYRFKNQLVRPARVSVYMDDD